MADRPAVVVAASPGGLRLRPLEAACRACTLGCGGRCDLFRADLAGELHLPPLPGLELHAGDRVLLSLDEAALRRAAVAGYGRALLGLLLGTAAGFGLAEALGLPRDPLTLLGLVAGTYAGLRGSKRAEPVPLVRLESASDAHTSDKGSSD